MMENTLTTRPLYLIRQEHINLITELEENGGDLTPELEKSLLLTEEEFQSKAISYGYVYKSFEDTEEIIDKEIDRLSLLKEKAAKRKDLFKHTLSDAMQQFGIDKIITPTISLSFRKSESVEIISNSDIPGKYFEEKTTFVISKTRIKEAIKSGEIITGAKLVTNMNLQIK